jgi:hypothetical protein
MNFALRKTTCGVLAASLLVFACPAAQAGLIGAEQATGRAADERALVLGTLERADVAKQLQAAGVSRQAARERVLALTDAEVQAMAREIQAAPAGGDGWLWIPVLIAVGMIWFYEFEYRK